MFLRIKYFCKPDSAVSV